MILFWISAILGVGFLILLHEFGHFLALKAVGERVFAFSIGFGKPLIEKTWRGTTYRLGWIPCGGYVMPESPAELDRKEAAGEPLFLSRPPLREMFVALMGPVANLMLAVILFFFVLTFWGTPTPSLTISSVVPGSPAMMAGLQHGDRITAFNGREVTTWTGFLARLQEDGGSLCRLEVDRAGTSLSIPIAPEARGGRYILGISPQTSFMAGMPWYQALPGAVGHVMMKSARILEAMFGMVLGNSGGEVAGPVGILNQVADAASSGLVTFISLLAILSINFAVFNLLPLPMLDGLRILLAMVVLVLGRGPTDKTLFPLYKWGAIGLGLIFLMITLRDLQHLFFS